MNIDGLRPGVLYSLDAVAGSQIQATGSPRLTLATLRSQVSIASSRKSDLASASSDAVASLSDYGAESAVSSDDSLDEEPAVTPSEQHGGPPTEGLHLWVNGAPPTSQNNRVAELLVEKRPQSPHLSAWDISKTRLGTALTGATALAPPGSAPSARRKSSSQTGNRRRALSPVPHPGSRSGSPAVAAEPPPLFKWRLFVRFELVPEVGLLTILLAFAAHQLRHPGLSDGAPFLLAKPHPLPMAPLLILVILLPLATLLRRWPRRYLHYPFTDERGYRDPTQADDGLAVGIAVPVLLGTSSLVDIMHAVTPQDIRLEGSRDLPEIWEMNGLSSRVFRRTASSQEIYSSLLQARISLLLLTLINAYVLLFNLLLARTVFKIAYLPENNTKRFFGAAALSASVSGALFLFLFGMQVIFGESPYVFPAEIACGTFLYQMSMYSISRLVRRGFSLGELSIASAAGIALALETGRLCWARWFYPTHSTIPSLYRAATPLVLFQHVLIPGIFITGFVLSPLLVLSRHIAAKPLRRLRWPQHKERNRRLLAAGVALGTVGIIVFALAPWASWALGGGIFRYAWSWAFRFVVFGGDGVQGMTRGELHGWARWRRMALGTYWLAVVAAAVGGWTTRLVRSRRIHMTQPSNPSPGTTVKVGVEAAREEKRKHVSLDLRRKFFHALAVVMFVPGIALDPAFTSLAFSVAFAIFALAEYARYFALYPIGAPIHVFFHEFTDAKDAGPVILSHFYLLTGCAGGLWLEGKGIKRFTGVLALGLGDALASIVGRRVGGPRWSATGSKTIIGSVAFTVSICLSAFALRWAGLVEPFSRSRYIVATCIAATLEAVSTQNDNLTVPLVMWSVLSLLNV